MTDGMAPHGGLRSYVAGVAVRGRRRAGSRRGGPALKGKETFDAEQHRRCGPARRPAARGLRRDPHPRASSPARPAARWPARSSPTSRSRVPWRRHRRHPQTRCAAGSRLAAPRPAVRTAGASLLDARPRRTSRPCSACACDPERERHDGLRETCCGAARRRPAGRPAPRGRNDAGGRSGGRRQRHGRRRDRWPTIRWSPARSTTPPGPASRGVTPARDAETACSTRS